MGVDFRKFSKYLFFQYTVRILALNTGFVKKMYRKSAP